jgi:hypothetical protein
MYIPPRRKLLAAGSASSSALLLLVKQTAGRAPEEVCSAAHRCHDIDCSISFEVHSEEIGTTLDRLMNKLGDESRAAESLAVPPGEIVLIRTKPDTLLIVQSWLR